MGVTHTPNDPMTYRKKLIEVALPLEAINKESAREKSIRHGHPSTLHLWWARRPLAACRAVLFASLVDDPSNFPDKFPTEEAQEKERKRLFDIIEKLVKWENVTNKEVLDAAKAEILKSTNNNPPPVLDPFCGGGSIPLEAQRLGLEAHGSDLNPVAVLITKALIEIPPKFANQPPVNPDSRSKIIPNPKSKTKNLQSYYGAQGLAEDVRYYGKWMRDEAFKRIGHLYPKVDLPQEYGGGEATVIAWLWARTVKCPNPACGARMPLVRSFALSTKKGREAWVEPIVDNSQRPPVVNFQVKTGNGKPQEGTVSRKGAVCVCCGTPVPLDYVRSEGKGGRMDAQLMAIVAEGKRQRVYLSPNKEHEEITAKAQPDWKPETDLPEKALGFRVQAYGMTGHSDLFTARQLSALTTFSNLVNKVRGKILTDALAVGMANDCSSFCEGESGASAYADGVATYLAMGVSRTANTLCTIARWTASREQTVTAFARQALPMTWDYPEVNPFAGAAGDLQISLSSVCEALENLPSTSIPGTAKQIDAREIGTHVSSLVISTDPPYYDNIGYADLSDFFYVWLRSSLGKIYPDILSTLLTPKKQELIATPYRFDGDKKKAQEFFEEGLNQAFSQMRKVAHLDYPFSVFYAFKQAESEEDDEGEVNFAIASTGWETMLEGLIKAGFTITGTLPMRTELSNRSVASGTNALSSSIVLVCRPRPETAPSTTRRQFVNLLKRELPDALQKLQQGNIAPVDLAQASIGPGMAIYSRYSKVLESDGTAMRVRTALQLINLTLDEYFAEQEGEFDAETGFALTWFEQYAFNEGLFGEAETLSKAKNTAVQGLVDAGILIAKAGKARLLRREELAKDWNPLTDNRLTAWEATQYMIRVLLDGGGENSAASLLSQLGTIGEATRELAYRLYNICDRKGWSSEANAYNSLVMSWPEISRLASEVQEASPVQMSLI
jgi:putative DNA methylase